MENIKSKMESRPLRQQIRHAFIAIITCSIISTILTWTACALIFGHHLSTQTINPANHYEKQLPQIKSFIHDNELQISDSAFQPIMDKQIPIDGIKYQVTDKSGGIRYGTLTDTMIDSSAELLRLINTTVHIDGAYMEVVPFGDASGNLSGAVLLVYQLKATAVSIVGRIWLVVLFVFMFAAPFLYILLFARIFSYRLTRRINKPLLKLNEAIVKIMEQNLDFTIDYDADNELGELCRAFMRMKEELAKTLAEQWRLEQERTDMVAALAHDLKAPLAVINVYAESLRSKPDMQRERVIRYLEVVQDNVQKCTVLVKQMQYSTEIEMTDKSEKIQEVSIKEYLEKKRNAYQLLGDDSQVEVIFNLDIDTDDVIYTDADKLDRILDNLISNSLEYTPPEGKLMICAEKTGEYLKITVIDTGSGFTQSDITNATHRFYRGDSARSKDGNHAGLGLYISSRLIHQLNGEMVLGNNLDGGARVILNLPLGKK